MTEPTKPALTVEQQFSEWWNFPKAVSDRRKPELMARDAWQASRRRTLEEVVAKLRRRAHLMLNTPVDRPELMIEAAIAFNKQADELEAELDSKETGQ